MVIAFFMCGATASAQQYVAPGQIGKVYAKQNINFCEEDITSAANGQEFEPLASTVSSQLLGSSGNLYTIIRNTQNVIAVDNASGSMAFIHRNNPDIGEPEGSNNTTSQYRLDVSRDGGETWENDSYPLNPNTPHENGVDNGHGRYPQVALFNPGNSSDPDDVWFYYAGATHDGTSTNVWDGVCYGHGELRDPATASENNYDGSNEDGSVNQVLIPNSLTEGRPGEFWNVDFEQGPAEGDPNTYLTMDILVYKSTINGDGELTHELYTKLDPRWDLAADGTAQATSLLCAFSPDGETGYVVVSGDAAVPSCGQFTLSPVYFITTDGGETWSDAQTMNLTNLDGFMDFRAETTEGDLVDWTPTLGFDSDAVVDQNGNLHLAAATSGTGTDGEIDENGIVPDGTFSIATGEDPGVLIVDFIYNPEDDEWGAVMLDSLISFRTGTNVVGDFSLDQQMQASRTESGDRVFFTWTDSLSLVDVARDVKGIGLDVNTGLVTPVKSFTADDEDWAGQAYFMHSAVEVLSSGGTHEVATVVAQIISDDLNPVFFHYLGDISYADDEFTVEPEVSVYVPSAPSYGSASSEVTNLTGEFTFGDVEGVLCYIIADFGDGTVMTFDSEDALEEGLLTLAHTYPNADGTYDVLITIGNIDGEVSEAFTVEIFEIVDETPPGFSFTDGTEIVDGQATLEVEAQANSGQAFSYPSFEAIDDVSGDITNNVVVEGEVDDDVPGEYEVVYTISDDVGNETSVTLTVIVVDSVAPELLVDGSVPVCAGEAFDPADYFNSSNLSVEDAVDGNLNDAVVYGDLDTSEPGTSTLSLSVTDEAGNEASTSVDITVEDCNPESVDAALSAKFELFPNPTQGQFVLSGAAVDADDATVTVYNVVGELVAEYTQLNLNAQVTLDLSEQASGMYMLYINTAEGTAAKRVILSK